MEEGLRAGYQIYGVVYKNGSNLDGVHGILARLTSLRRALLMMLLRNRLVPNSV
jgi:hypothetical protein